MEADAPGPFPPLYAAWMKELFAGPPPAEPRATCHACAMLGDEQAQPERFFHPATKCCTYVPLLPNFLVGRVLTADDAAAGRATVEKRIDTGVGVTPFALLTPPPFVALYQRRDDVFGRVPALRCPHYLEEAGGLCGIWQNRNGICSTWFCKLERGAVALAYWEAARDLLIAVEGELARWCMLKLEIGAAAFEFAFPVQSNEAPLSAATLDELADAPTPQRIWGQWHGREREFYRECARLVSLLSWTEVLALCGSTTRERARQAQAAYQSMLSRELPTRLRLGALTVTETAPDHYRVETPAYDREGLKLTATLLKVLPRFDGRPTTAVLQQIEQEDRLQIEAGLLRRLVDFGVLLADNECTRGGAPLDC